MDGRFAPLNRREGGSVRADLRALDEDRIPRRGRALDLSVVDKDTKGRVATRVAGVAGVEAPRALGEPCLDLAGPQGRRTGGTEALAKRASGRRGERGSHRRRGAPKRRSARAEEVDAEASLQVWNSRGSGRSADACLLRRPPRLGR